MYHLRSPFLQQFAMINHFSLDSMFKNWPQSHPCERNVGFQKTHATLVDLFGLLVRPQMRQHLEGWIMYGLGGDPYEEQGTRISDTPPGCPNDE